MLCIKEVMREKQISSIALAKGVGVSPTTISYIITGRTSTSLSLLSEIATFLNVKVWELFQEYREQAKTEQQTETSTAIQAIVCPKCGTAIRINVATE